MIINKNIDNRTLILVCNNIRLETIDLFIFFSDNKEKSQEHNNKVN